ncbi:MAG: cytochrome c biogenesis protein ResB [bacterium]
MEKNEAHPLSKGKNQPGKDMGILSSIYYSFNSIKLTVSLFILLGLVSIAGTIIEQGGDPAKYAQEYSETTIRVFRFLGLFDMYHTPWFLTILLLLLLNLIVCTIERLPRVVRFAKNIKPVLDMGDEKKYPFVETLRIQGNTPDQIERQFRRYTRIPPWILLVDILSLGFAAFLAYKYPMNVLEFVAFILVPITYIVLLNFRGKVVRTEHQGAVHIFLNQWLLSRFGVYIAHASIVIIFLGAIIGSLFGFKGYMQINEGETTNQMYLRSDKLIDTVPAALRSLFSKGGHADQAGMTNEHNNFKSLPFAIRCDDFSISYYENTGRPKDYTSNLVVIRDGREVEKKTIEVNSPLIVDNIYFYQSSYGQTGRPGVVVLSVSLPGVPAQDYGARINGSFSVEGTGAEIMVNSFVPDFTIVNGHVTQRSNELINPAVYITATEGEKILFSGWMFPNYPEYSIKTGNFDIRFKDYWGSQYTGIQVAYDPGVEVVWIGCSLLVVGLLISFFHSHQRIWARISGDEIVLAGSTHKNQMAFEHKFNELKNLLKD